MNKVLSLHFGLSFGGIAKYAQVLERVRKYVPLTIKSLCVLPRGRIVDEVVLAELDAVIIQIDSIFNLNLVRQVSARIKRESPNCIISHGFNGHLTALVGRMLANVDSPLLATYHGSYHATTRVRRFIEPIYNVFTHLYLKHKAEAVISVAKYCADFLVAQGVDRKKITVVHNGLPDIVINPKRRSVIRSEWEFNDDHIVVGTASRLDPVKGLADLIDAFAKITMDHPKTRMVIMGDGTLADSLKGRAKTLDVDDRIHFTGRRDDVPDCLTALDIFALPSLAEYHSIGLLEAMRAGLPIVATDVGGNTESVRHEMEGLIVKPNDSDELAKALNRLLGDKKLRVKLAFNARERFLAEFTEEITLQRTAEWLQQVCQNKKSYF